MKKRLLFKTLVMTIAICGSAFAWVDADSVMNIVKTSTAPIIDGVMDDVWKMVGKERLTKFDLVDATIADDWFDCFGTVRALWDEENLYLFLEMNDETIATTSESASNYEYDSVEMYFDADNSKTDGAFDSIDDIQLRYNLGQTALDEIDTGFGSGGTDWGFAKDVTAYAAVETGMGWNLEVQIPLADLKLPSGEAAVNHEFGFDVQINDRDGEQRDHMLRWWANSNQEWTNAGLFGTARFINDYVVNDYALPVGKGAFVPNIDGELETEWCDIPDLSENVYSANTAANKSAWNDGTFNIKIMWNGDKIYLFAKAWDDLIQMVGDYQADGFELYFDGDNSKAEANYDGIDDVQLRIKYGIESTANINAGGVVAPAGFAKDSIDFSWLESDDGWNIELSIPLATLNISAEAETEFGFDVQFNESDAANVRETGSKWWSSSDNSWKDASLFGTAMLKSYTFGTQVTSDGTHNGLPNDYILSENYPNPFNPTTRIQYMCPTPGLVKLRVFNALGNQIADLVNEVKQAGSYEVVFDGKQLPSGIYFYKLETSSGIMVKKMMLIQ
ncbi:MAG: T9SS C-terminal target domain-containing protein [Calditrichaeota bacterium]|nr:MAG: T9SS C-terminal target domain-containing protein [Calditrichota bacterium]